MGGHALIHVVKYLYLVVAQVVQSSASGPLHVRHEVSHTLHFLSVSSPHFPSIQSPHVNESSSR